jgi:hypothetical protein
MDYKQRVNKKQKLSSTRKQDKNVEIDNPPSSGGRGKYMKYVSVPWPQLEAALSILNASLFVKNSF